MVTAFLVNSAGGGRQATRRGVAVPDSARSCVQRMVRQPCSVDPALKVTSWPKGTRVSGLAMAYRDHVEFTVGHGTGVHAIRSTDDPTQAVRVETTAVPSYEVPRTTTVAIGLPRHPAARRCRARTWPSSRVVGQRRADRAASSACRCLPRVDRTRAGAYCRPSGTAEWVRARSSGCAESDALTPPTGSKPGSNLLAAEPVAVEAFRFANRAMWQQRVALGSGRVPAKGCSALIGRSG